MKPFTMFKLLTLASLLLYTLGLKAQGTKPTAAAAAAPAAAPPAYIMQKQGEINAANREDKVRNCVDTANNVMMGNPNSKQVSLDSDKILAGDRTSLAALAKDNPEAFAAYKRCSAGTNSDDTKNEAECNRTRDKIAEDAKALSKECSNAPKLSSEDSDDGSIDTADPKNKPHTDWGICLWNAHSCRTVGLGDNDSASSCSETSLEEMARSSGNDEAKMKSFCKDKYPPQCGSADKTDLRSVAKDLDKDLTSDLVDAQKDIALKKRDIQENQDKLIEVDKALEALPSKFDKQTKELQKQYEAMMKASNQALDASLENYYKMIATDEQAVKTSAAAVTMADAARFDAQNKFVNACKAKAKAMADQEFPTGGKNYGGTNALITRNARWTDYYTKQLQDMYADGTTCDNGNYANAQLAMLNAQKAQTDSEAQLAQDQNQLRVGIQQVASKKNDANYRGLKEQGERVGQLSKQQEQDYTAAITDRQKIQKRAVEMQQELMKLEAKVAAGPKKKQCIQTIRSCAKYVGTSSSGKDTPDLTKAPDILAQIISACQRSARKCSSEPPDALIRQSLADFQAIENYKTLGEPPRKNLPYDINESICSKALAADIEKEGPVNKRAKKSTAVKSSDGKK